MRILQSSLFRDFPCEEGGRFHLSYDAADISLWSGLNISLSESAGLSTTIHLDRDEVLKLALALEEAASGSRPIAALQLSIAGTEGFAFTAQGDTLGEPYRVGVRFSVENTRSYDCLASVHMPEGQVRALCAQLEAACKQLRHSAQTARRIRAAAG